MIYEDIMFNIKKCQISLDYKVLIIDNEIEKIIKFLILLFRFVLKMKHIL